MIYEGSIKASEIVANYSSVENLPILSVDSFNSALTKLINELYFILAEAKSGRIVEQIKLWKLYERPDGLKGIKREIDGQTLEVVRSRECNRLSGEVNK